ncbi:MAG: dihydrolipoamide acetyltransferase family protein [Actinomycetota bacterium]
MATREFRLPDLGEGLEDGEIVRWLVKEGDEVALNQPLVEVDTAKALVELPSPFAGKVVRLGAGEGETVKVGSVLVTFEIAETEGATRKAVLVGYGVEEAAPKRRRRLTAPGRPAKAGPDGAGRAPAAPPVRRLAAELGVDLNVVEGSGPEGRITREDVMKEAEAGVVATDAKAGGEAAPEGEERLAVRGVRRLIAQRMSASARDIPHVTTFLTVDATELLGARDEARARSNAKVSALAVASCAFVRVCSKHPKLNSSWQNGEIVIKRYCHLGIATDTDRGLIVPVVRHAERLDVVELTGEIGRVADLARGGKASPDDLAGSTVTISNVGSFGAEYGTPIINPPEASILALGVIEDRAVAVAGAVAVRPTVVMSLSFDHRVMDGAEAGRALLDLKRLLEDPEAVRAL